MDADSINFDVARAGSADPAEISGRRSPCRARRLRLPRLLTWGSLMLVCMRILFRYVPSTPRSLLSSHFLHIRAHGCLPVPPPADPQLQSTLEAGKQLRRLQTHRVRGLYTSNSFADAFYLVLIQFQARFSLARSSGAIWAATTDPVLAVGTMHAC